MRKEIKAIVDGEQDKRRYGHRPITVITKTRIPESVKWHMRHTPYKVGGEDSGQTQESR